MTSHSLIYFNTQRLNPLIATSKHSLWADSPVKLWPEFVRSRVTKLDTPWPLSPTSISSIPTVIADVKFVDALDQIATEVCNTAERTGKLLYISWSGGIDSTSILTAVLKNASKNMLKNTVVLLNDLSIKENWYFYDKFILPNLTVSSVVDFAITESNYNKIILLDGEAGNQIMGSEHINDLVVSGEFDLLDTPLNLVTPERINFTNNVWYDIIIETTKLAPCDILTVYDLLWWINFNFKWDDVLLRKLPRLAQSLTSDQARDFYYNSLFRIYEHPLIQSWSINSLVQRRKDSRVMTKLAAKKYIYEYDRNDLYFSNCREKGSSTKQMPNSVFAIDQNWNMLKYSNPDHRRLLSSWITK